MTVRKREMPSVPGSPAPQGTETQKLKGEEERRLALLRQQKELERKDREQAMWREASKMPTPYGPGPEQHRPEELPKPVGKPAKQVTGLFAKLKLGKFLE
jgi:hypothetical protein